LDLCVPHVRDSVLVDSFMLRNPPAPSRKTLSTSAPWSLLVLRAGLCVRSPTSIDLFLPAD
jgi:hypothetical protein